MKQLLLTLSFIMANMVQAQQSEDERIAYFKSKVDIPKEYIYKNMQQIEVDKVKAYLYRYEKSYNQGHWVE